MSYNRRSSCQVPLLSSKNRNVRVSGDRLETQVLWRIPQLSHGLFSYPPAIWQKVQEHLRTHTSEHLTLTNEHLTHTTESTQHSPLNTWYISVLYSSHTSCSLAYCTGLNHSPGETSFHSNVYSPIWQWKSTWKLLEN